MASPSGGVFDLSVDVAAQQESKAGYVKPHHQNHYCAQRAVGAAVGIEEVQIRSEGEGHGNPEQDAEYRARRYPIPMLFFQIRRKVVDQSEGECDERDCQNRLHNFPDENSGLAHAVVLANSGGQISSGED